MDGHTIFLYELQTFLGKLDNIFSRLKSVDSSLYEKMAWYGNDKEKASRVASVIADLRQRMTRIRTLRHFVGMKTIELEKAVFSGDFTGAERTIREVVCTLHTYFGDVMDSLPIAYTRADECEERDVDKETLRKAEEKAMIEMNETLPVLPALPPGW